MSRLFNSLSQGQVQNPIQQLKADPVSFLRAKGFNIPDGVDARNPQAIINGLLQSGQIPNNRYQQILRMMGRR